jgi:HAMP domain-containing protein
LAGAISATALAGATAALLTATASSTSRPVRSLARTGQQSAAAAFSRLVPRPAPSSWPAATIASGAATLHYPSGWRAVTGDSGTVSAALRDDGGAYYGYLNVTPREGVERLAGWASFRARRNVQEGDRDVRVLSAVEHVHFAAATGSCVIDDYRSRVGSHAYRELACIVAGGRATSVLIGAAPVQEWPATGPVIERAASALLER